MSALENEVKPHIESILDDRLTSLSPSAQSTFTTWAIKTVMVMEGVDAPATWFYSRTEREALRAEGRIPERTSVFIAKCVVQPDIYSAAKNHWTDAPDGEVRAHATTVAFGSLAFQVVTIRTPPTVPAHIQVTYDFSSGPWETTLVQVWPPRHQAQSWPPKHGLQGEPGLLALTDRLNPSSL